MKKKSLEQQVLYYQIAGITLAIILSLGISLYFIIRNEMAGLDRNITNVGAMLSKSPNVVAMLKEHQPSEEYSVYLDSIISSLEYVDVVTICDTNSVRFYHTDRDEIGQRFSGGDEEPILRGGGRSLI